MIVVIAAALVVPGGGAVLGQDVPEPIADTDPEPLVPVPFGCPPWAIADAVFAGTVSARDDRTVRFAEPALRAGALDAIGESGIIDVRFGTDAQYLEVGERYLVGVAEHPDLGLLVSSLGPEPVDFAGDEIIGVSEDDVACPPVQDPVVTLRLDGTAVPTPLLGPFVESRSRIAAAILIPTVIAFAVVFLLALLRVSTTGVIESLRGAAQASRRSPGGGRRPRP
ncbi:MAG: hypothetical protein RIR49_1680 [Actinomycetota bacterium]